ncbi:hypothetical protein [Chitinophaga agri]|uniref:Uncharacterized protein n=1 Tax=Chitinophaga agri TaxID=2703787 RepID=A0A6B9Z8Q6_9BACT|nr:hypothetical protein [Chitinophaga agri]QHS58387.1 hypothetical protein GWR21_01895 [Chitinophaga agri]
MPKMLSTGTLLLNNYFDSPNFRFKRSLADQEYKALQCKSLELDQLAKDVYSDIKRELGNEWNDLQWYDALHFDKMGSAICDVLFYNVGTLRNINEKQQKRLIKLAELGFTNYADQLCTSLGLPFDHPKEFQDPAVVEAFFNPSVRQDG